MAERRITRTQISAYAELSYDRNPLHVDEAEAARSPFGGIVAHGFLLLGDALSELARQSSYPKTLECKFHAPGRPNEALTTSIAASGALIIRSGDTVLVTGQVRLDPKNSSK